MKKEKYLSDMPTVPRRCRLDHLEVAELAIVKAIEEVEKLGASTRLTKTVVLLSECRDLVADYLEDGALS